MLKSRTSNRSIAAIDLFCGAGGLTHGLLKAGIAVAAGIDVDPACGFPFEANNHSKFVLGDVAEVTGDELLASYPKNAARVLVGCAPCQPFSRYSRRQEPKNDRKWGLLVHFSRLVKEVRPVVISMENVPELASHQVFHDFVNLLQDLGYHVGYSNAFCPDYGIPQHRTRLILFASLLGAITPPPRSHGPDEYRTVKETIADLPAISRGKVHPQDPLHRACNLSDLNLKRIRASRPGGCWREWPDHLVAECHRAESGKTYPSVYGRMEWDQPSPTITTQFFGFGNGRFGHPEQDRAISLREGSLLQSFPRTYRFCESSSAISFSVLGRLIGNAVPVRLGEIIGETILKHLEEHDV